MSRPWPADPKLWTPQPGPQQRFVTCPVFEVVYGGARGGGKTDAALGDFLHHALNHGSAARGLLIRRTRAALEPTVQRAREIFTRAGGAWDPKRRRFRFPSGAVLYLRPLDRDAEAETYQGHDYTRVYVEELTQFPRPQPIDRLKATLRSAAGVPCGFRATCNPGGPGHGWVKQRYVDAGAKPVDCGAGLQRLFIPARLSDNPALLANDPGYVERLKQAGSAALVRAWLEGDWSAVGGAFFDGWSGANVIQPFVIPPRWPRLRSFDWGLAVPFSVGWWAYALDDTPVLSEAGLLLARRGAMIRYREWYGAGAGSGEGARLDPEAVAEGILERDGADEFADSVADPSIFHQNGGPSIGERMARAGVRFRRADNTRVGRAGAQTRSGRGWDQVRARINGDAGVEGGGAAGDGPGGAAAPMLFVFDTCRDFIRTVPAMTHDKLRPDDLDSSGEDHIADETRYACLARVCLPEGVGRRG